jgi:MFS superfamily sulfate permease-like transporter
MNDLKREIQEAKKLHLSWRTRLFIFIICAPTVFLFGVYGRLELAMPLIIIIGVHGLVVLFKWKLRRQAWFWIAMTVSAALHIPLILFVPWRTRWVPGPALAGIATVDFCLILWILLVVGKFMGRPKGAER